MLVVAIGISCIAMDPKTNLQETSFFLFTIKHGASPEAFEGILGIRMLGKAYYLTKLKRPLGAWCMTIPPWLYDDLPGWCRVKMDEVCEAIFHH